MSLRTCSVLGALAAAAADCPCAGCPDVAQDLPHGGACCHGGVAGQPCESGKCTCEVQNWLPSTCTGDFGVWCPASPSPAPAPTPPAPTPPAPTPPAPTPPPSPPSPPAPRGPGKYVNYVINMSSVPEGPIGGTHLVLSFMEPSTPSIPGDGDDSWLKYTLEELLDMSAGDREQRLEKLRSEGTRIMASLGGAAASHSIYSKYDPAAFGARAAKYIVDLGLDGLDVDLEGWGNDPKGADFLKALTKAAFETFQAAPGGKKYVLSHAPEMPDFWHGVLYTAVMADREIFDMIDFVNVQMYNQLMFPSADHVFTKDIYDPAMGAPSSMATIAAGIEAASGGSVTASEAEGKLLLGFPCKDGSFPVGGANLHKCGQPQFELVRHGLSLGYPLAGVFEWSAAGLSEAELRTWNTEMRKAMGEAGLVV